MGFCTQLPRVSIEKALHLLLRGRLQPLEVPTQKWDQVVIAFVTDLPKCDGKDAVLTVVNKATKMVYFIPCTKSITGKETAQLFWSSVGCLHGTLSTIISDWDVRFTRFFCGDCGVYWGIVYEWELMLELCSSRGRAQIG